VNACANYFSAAVDVHTLYDTCQWVCSLTHRKVSAQTQTTILLENNLSLTHYPIKEKFIR